MLGKSIVPPFARTERDLVRAAQAGNQRAIEYLITRHQPVCKLVRWQMRQLDPAGRHHDELRAAANLALLEALPNFDATRGFRFATYAAKYVRGAMLKTLFPDQRTAREETRRRPVRLVALDGPLARHAEDADDCATYERELFRRDKEYGLDPGFDRVLHADRDAAVRTFVSSLSDGQRGVVVDLFWHGKTHAEVARQRGVSRPAVSRALARACKRGHTELAPYAAASAA